MTNDEKKIAVNQTKDLAVSFLDLLSSFGQSRELSLAKTKVEEAMLWAMYHFD